MRNRWGHGMGSDLVRWWCRRRGCAKEGMGRGEANEGNAVVVRVRVGGSIVKGVIIELVTLIVLNNPGM